MSNLQEFEEFIISLEKLSLEGSYNLLHDAINKNIDIFSKNITHLDQLYDKLDTGQHSLIIMAILYIKFTAAVLINYELAVNQFEKFITLLDFNQIARSIDIFIKLCHNYTETLVKQKIPIKGILPLTKAIKSIQNSPTQLTSLHADICHLCLSARCLQSAIPILNIDILSILKEGKNCNSKYFLLYYYYGGLIYLGNKNYQRALFFFEQAITTPAVVVSLIMVEAFKKYIITSLILHNKVVALPKYTSNVVSRFIKPLCQPYMDIAQTYTANNVLQLDAKIAEYTEILNKDGNMGLMNVCKKALYKNNIKRLTKIYATISLSTLSTLAKLPNMQKAEQLLVEMINKGEMCGKIDKQRDMITFHEDPQFFANLTSLDEMDKQATDCMQLQALINKMNQEIGLDPQYVQKSLGMSEDESGTSTKLTAPLAN